MSLGPWFKCFPGEFLNGMRDMDARKQGFYCQIIFRMYEAADAIYADDRTIGRWCNSNKRPWEKIRDELIAEGRLVILPDGGLINPRALREMTEQAERNSQVPDFIRERLGKLSQMFAESFGKESQKIRETFRENPTKTEPLIEARSQKPDLSYCDARESEIDPVLIQCLEAAGLAPSDLPDRPNLNSHTDILNLTEPVSGEPCDLERDVLPAIRAGAAKLADKGQTLNSWRYFREASIRNRDERLAGTPDVRQPERGTAASFAGGSPRQSSNPAFRLLSRIQAAQGGGNFPGDLQEQDAFTIDHEEVA